MGLGSSATGVYNRFVAADGGVVVRDREIFGGWVWRDFTAPGGNGSAVVQGAENGGFLGMMVLQEEVSVSDGPRDIVGRGGGGKVGAG